MKELCGRVRYKLTDATGSWYATGPLIVGKTPQQMLALTRKRALKRGIQVSYELATKEEYFKGNAL